MFCPRCGFRQPLEHRFCVSCGTPLPRHLLRARGPKVSRLFHAVPVVPADPVEAYLRVSRYLEEMEVETLEGTLRIPGSHVRFSIWVGDRALCAASLPEDEARSMAEFVLASAQDGEDAPVAG